MAFEDYHKNQRPNILVGLLDGTIGTPSPLQVTDNKLKTVNYYWNPNTLAYVVSTGGGDGVGNEVKVTNTVPVTFSGGVALDAGTLAALETISVANFPATQAVTGTFFQATQPVSAASLPLPTGAATETTLGALNTKVTAVNTNAVVLAAGAAIVGSLVANQSINHTQINGTAIAVGSGVVTPGVQRVVLPTDVPLPAGTNAIGTTLGPVLTKGTQGSVGHSVQDLKDAGRVLVTFSGTLISGVTSEALINLFPIRDLSVGGPVATHAVTANKRLRIQTIVLSLRSTSTVNVGVLVRFRMLAGSVLINSPVHNSVGGMSSNITPAVIGNAQTYSITFPDGFEMSGTMQFGLTQLASATSVTLDVHVTGYEY